MGLKTLTVSELNNYLKRILMYDPILNNLMIKGEISNFKLHNSGHCYFSLKDSKSKLKCVMFRSDFKRLKFMPEDGMNVIIKGYISIYERNGEYQLYVNSIEQVGLGDLYLEFEKLKEKLSKEGYFDEDRKQRIPFMSKKIAVITSPTGAAIRDVISVITRRNNYADILVYPVLVQGEKAPLQISKAIEKLNDIEDLDLIILTRGGGSIEELWAFNEEIVAHSIYHSKKPIISAVGHETDFTISDFVSDMRAPTPSAAGELAVPSINEVNNTIDYLYNNLKRNILNKFSSARDVLENYSSDRIKHYLSFKIRDGQQTLDHLYTNIRSNIDKKLTLSRDNLISVGSNLNNLSPLATIKRGYGIVLDEENNKIVSSTDNVKTGDIVNVLLKDGTIKCTVDDKMKGENIFERR
ncbi:exodeoxyribonuclease VII large subunit [Maledivibacter halophilus]|uniref:Exodeoxyribonuclease 7 large subunit n=1 Tax=Maledivibacter halophilus TaxID=36842 RepID=A0A1T5L8E1_9FIRM|nr:exodeoxyribonuclease VII large subunit [Maledivibacter halophilus]SKC72251.1 Exodeoxyribonuclease VII large subunit [Maledivibacter halophilus]